MSRKRILFFLVVVVILAAEISIPTKSQYVASDEATLIAGRNVNMVSGTQLPDGDPWLQRQNEPSIAVSTRNPLHLLAGANDYRTVDMPDPRELPGTPIGSASSDAWLGVFKSFDGGESWISKLLPGFPQDDSSLGQASPIKGFSTAADPVVRAGTNGLFYYSGIAFNRTRTAGQINSVIFVARFIDNNNMEGGDSIEYIDTKVIANIGEMEEKKFIDKPWIAVDVPKGKGRNVTIKGQKIASHNVYIVYTIFSENDSMTSEIVFQSSEDCGESWGKAIVLDKGKGLSQGAVIAVDPNGNGHVYVAWRQFDLQKPAKSAIIVARSVNAGKSFHKVVKVAEFPPFDQPATTDAMTDPPDGTSFRTNSYPALAVDSNSYVYLAWSQRGWGPSGEARIVLSTSTSGINWSLPSVVDTDGLGTQGHQFMPSMSFAAGKLTLVWYDQREDIYGIWYGFDDWISDGLTFEDVLSGVTRPVRHTIDVFAAQADVRDYPNLQWEITQVSKYLHTLLVDFDGSLYIDNQGNYVVIPVQFNPPNFPLFKIGTLPFAGDYLDVSPSPMFVLGEDGIWRFNMEPSDTPVFHIAWTDNRDVRPPLNEDWTNYTPPYSVENLGWESSERSDCIGGNNPGMRNQNIYTSELTRGILAGSPTNTKPLDLIVPRSFVVFVKNNEAEIKSFRLSIPSQPPGGQASFLQFELLESLDVIIAPYSTISRPVFVQSSDPDASVRINVDEISGPGGDVVEEGLKSFVYLNTDPESPEIDAIKDEETHNPNIVNPNIVNWIENPNIVNPNIVNWIENPNIVNPNIVNPNIVNPNIVNPNIVNPNIVNPNIVNPNIVNPNIVNPNIVNPNIVNPNIVNPNIVNPNIVNPNIVNANPEDLNIYDITWKVTNEGNTATSFTFKTFSKKALPAGVYAQLLIYRIYYTPAVAGALHDYAADECKLRLEPHQELLLNVINPNIVNPNIVNPNIVNPNIVNASIENATFSLGPGEEALVTLLVIETEASQVKIMQTGETFDIQEFAESVGAAATAQSVNSEDAALGITTPPAAATQLIIGTSSLPDGIVGTYYSAQLIAYGGTPSYNWSLTSGEIPPGLSLIGDTIHGTPTTAGLFHFIIRVDDDGSDFDTQQFSIYMDSDTTTDPLTITTTSLPNGVKDYWYGATLEATGGVWPRTWSLASGSLPDGLALDSGGVISGTPTATGTYGFVVKVTDATGDSDTASRSIEIKVAATTYYTISGTVYNENTSDPLEGVVMRGLPNTPITDSNGSYSDSVPEGWSGIVTPFKSGHTFDPSSRTYTNVTANQQNQDYNQPISQSEIKGKVIYNGSPVTGYTTSQVNFWARNEGTGQSFPISPTYNNSTAEYSIPNVPSGTYGIEIKIDAVEPFDGKYFPGDYYGWTSPIVVIAPTTVNIDLPCSKIIRLTSPVNNNPPGILYPPPYPTHISPITFQWDGITEATTYDIYIERRDDTTFNSTGDPISIPGITSTQQIVDLPLSGNNEHYEFHLYARNISGVMVGQLMVVYVNASGQYIGHGWDYRFKVVSGSLSVSREGNWEYPPQTRKSI